MSFFKSSKQKKAEKINNEGLELAQNGEMEAALAKFQEAVNVDPACFWAYGNIGNCYKLSDDLKMAITYYSQALKVNSKHVESLYGRANAYQSEGQYVKAMADYEMLQKLGGSKELGIEAEVVQKLNTLKTLVAIKKLGADMSPLPPSGEIVPKVQEMLTSGRTRLREGDVKGAIAIFTHAVKRDSAQEELYNNRGIAYLQGGRLKEAAADFIRVLRINPQNATAYANRGSVFTLLDDMDGAIADYTKAIQLNPDVSDFHSQRGNIYRKKGELTSALRDLIRALKLDPNNAGAYYHYGLALNAREEYMKAIQAYSRALQLEPTNTNAYMMRGMAYAAVGMFSKGVADLQTYIQRGDGTEASIEEARKFFQMMRQQVE